MDVSEFYYTVHGVPLLRFSNFSATGFGIKLHQVMCFFVFFCLNQFHVMSTFHFYFSLMVHETTGAAFQLFDTKLGCEFTCFD